MKSLIASLFALAFVVSAGAASAQMSACVNNSSGELKVATCSTSDNTGCHTNERCISLGAGTGYQLACAQFVFDCGGMCTQEAVATCPAGKVALGCTLQHNPAFSVELDALSFTDDASGDIAHEGDTAAVGCEAELTQQGNATVQVCVTCENAPN